ncbi:MAG: hypothetical protein ABI142_13395, partial [Bryocella sp.]
MKQKETANSVGIVKTIRSVLALAGWATVWLLVWGVAPSGALAQQGTTPPTSSMQAAAPQAAQGSVETPPTNPSAPVGTPQAATDAAKQPGVTNALPALEPSLWSKRGDPVTAIRFAGVELD